MEIRRSPPWTDGPYSNVPNTPAVRVKYVDGFYIIEAAGGHIIGSTQDPLILASLIRMESQHGRRAVEYELRGEPAFGCAGIGSGLDVERSAKKKKVVCNVDLADLGL